MYIWLCKYKRTFVEVISSLSVLFIQLYYNIIETNEQRKLMINDCKKVFFLIAVTN